MKLVLKYFEEIEKLSHLIHVAGYKVKEEARNEGGQIDESSFLVARTNTTPYTYYVRSLIRSHFPAGWSRGKISVSFMFARTAFWQKLSGARPTDRGSNHCVRATRGCASCLSWLRCLAPLTQNIRKSRV